MIYYEQDGIKVRDALPTDMFQLRESDINEVWASHHHKPEEALRQSIEQSFLCYTIENGNPVASFGLVPENIISNKATVWMLASEDLNKIKIRFLINCKKFINLMLEYYPYLYNYVDDRNKKSIEWLLFLGAKMEDPRPYGTDKLPFRYFYFIKENV